MQIFSKKTITISNNQKEINKNQYNNRFNFKPFFERFRKIYPSKPLPNQHFLEWFVGFTEGDGALPKYGNGSIGLEIELHSKDQYVLDLIANQLGIGSVTTKKTRNSCQFIIRNLTDGSLMVALFNGNCVLPKFYHEKFVPFLERYNQRVKSPIARSKTKALGIIDLKPLMINPSLEDAWLSGFTDAEGNFYENVMKNHANHNITRVKHFRLYQHGLENKPVLEQLTKTLKCGEVSTASRNNQEYRLMISDFEHCVNTLVPYFKKFTLKTVKRVDFDRWCIVVTAMKTQFRRQNAHESIHKIIDIQLKKLIIEYKSNPELKVYFEYLMEYLAKIEYFKYSSIETIKKES